MLEKFEEGQGTREKKGVEMQRRSGEEQLEHAEDGDIARLKISRPG